MFLKKDSRFAKKRLSFCKMRVFFHPNQGFAWRYEH